MDVFAQRRTWHRSRRLAVSQLACLGRHTGTARLATAGRLDVDWSADYRFFSQDRWQPQRLFDPILRGVLALSGPGAPLVVAMDDTHLPKTGAKIPGVGYRRDPLSPPFHTNLIRAQRFLQISALAGGEAFPGPARALPIRFDHVPPVTKPKHSAPPEEWRAYRQQCRQENLSTAGLAALVQTRHRLDQELHGHDRLLITNVDGSYCNGPVLKGLPDRTVLIGRIRKDAKFFHLPTPRDQQPRGTRRLYGQPAPTPEALRQLDATPWQEVTAFAAGQLHTFRVKTIAPVLWAKAGPQRPLRLIVIAPVGYRLRAGARLLYRQPAFLICTDPNMPLQQVVQYYLWRWDIEVNHRDEKQFIGAGEAQVRSPLSVGRDPAFAVACYSTLLLAGLHAYGPPGTQPRVPVPKWRAKTPKRRVTTQDLIHQLRRDLWGQALDCLEADSSHFVSEASADPKCPEFHPSLAAAVFYASTG